MPDELASVGHTASEEASAEAVHKAKGAAQAVEAARQAQLAELVQQTAQSTRDALMAGLKEVFGDSDAKDPDQMKILIRRVPILCTQITQMHEDLANMRTDSMWSKRIFVFAAPIMLAVFGWSLVWEINTSTQVASVSSALNLLTQQAK